MKAQVQADGTLYFPGAITEGDRIRLVRFLGHHFQGSQVWWIAGCLRVVLSGDHVPITLPDRDTLVKFVAGVALGLMYRWEDLARGVA